MKRVLVSVALLLAVAALRPAQGTAQASTDRQSFTFQDVVTCANNGLGEDVDVSGQFTLVEHPRQSASGNTQFTFKVSAHGTAVGQTTGDRYTFNSQTREHTVMAVDGAPYTMLIAFKAQLNGKGSASNQWLSGNMHVVINANGDMTSEVNNFRFECK